MHNLLTLFTALGALTQLVWARGLFALDPSQYQWLITFFFSFQLSGYPSSGPSVRNLAILFLMNEH